MTVQDKVYNDYMRGMKYKDIAEKYNVSINTLKWWKSRYKWERKGHIKKGRSAPFHNHNAKGAAVGNTYACKHDLYRKYLPKSILDIVMNVDDASTADILWMNIKILYAKILHAMNIVYVVDAEDNTILTQSTSIQIDPRTNQKTGASKSNYIETAIQKEVAGISAIARSMGTLNKMIRQYEEMIRQTGMDDEQKLRLEKLKAEIEVLKKNGQLNDDLTGEVNVYLPENHRETE